MNLKARYFDPEEDYPTLLLWWMERNRPATPMILLPRTGVMMESEDGRPLCCGFLYVTDSGCAQIAHLVSEPNAGKEERGQAVEVMILNLVSLAKSMGFLFVSAGATLPRLLERYKKLGFQVYDEGVTHVGMSVMGSSKERKECQQVD